MLENSSDVSNSFIDVLPDTMKLDVGTVIFIIVLINCLFFILKYSFFKPILNIIDERETAIRSSAESLASARILAEQQQKDYALRLKDVRLKIIEERKILVADTAKITQELLTQARQKSNSQRTTAMTELSNTKEIVKAELMTKIDALSESVVQHILR